MSTLLFGTVLIYREAEDRFNRRVSERPQLAMTPAPGERLLRFVGDRVVFSLDVQSKAAKEKGWRAFLRTNLGNAGILRKEILSRFDGNLTVEGGSLRDIPMKWDGTAWKLDLVLTETGFFKAKAYLMDPNGWQHWPEGPDAGLCVQPDFTRTANTIYCAFPRMFGPNKIVADSSDPGIAPVVEALDKAGYTVIPPSGKLRDVTRELPHIIQTLGCRVLHLLPVNPTPTTLAKFGRFGSPYACEDLIAVDPALVEFDRCTTGVQQFEELARETHRLGGRLFLDMVINHTGWGSTLYEEHPEWFVRKPDGHFHSPGAWGTVWEDLVELDDSKTALWPVLAEAFLTWCRRGVDGFRCDAGYQVPVPVWQYIVARVREEFPDVVFLLEGLGGSWEATEELLCEGGMQWAYSELFQNFSGVQLHGYLGHSFIQAERVGILVHYSETHDNDRLAKGGREWSLLRNRLCALASTSGGFGFTNGVEWLAKEKILVHQSKGLAWGARDNIVPELGQLNLLLANHPCFFDGTKIEIFSQAEEMILGLRRTNPDYGAEVIVLVNTDATTLYAVTIPSKILATVPKLDLLGQPLPKFQTSAEGLKVTLAPAACYCFSAQPMPDPDVGDEYRRLRAWAGMALKCLGVRFKPEQMGLFDWRELGGLFSFDPGAFLGAVNSVIPEELAVEVVSAMKSTIQRAEYRPVVRWQRSDLSRVFPVPSGHWVLMQDEVPFRTTIQGHLDMPFERTESLPTTSGHFAILPPQTSAGTSRWIIERFGSRTEIIEAQARFYPEKPRVRTHFDGAIANAQGLNAPVVLLTNGRGGMSRIRIDLGSVASKYDCILGANLDAEIPVDRHIFVKRMRVWVDANGFITALNADRLVTFSNGSNPEWIFKVPCGDGQTTTIRMRAHMPANRNEIQFCFDGVQTAKSVHVRLAIRLDLEDRGFHSETHRNGGSEHHFRSHCRGLQDQSGFSFQPAPDRRLSARCLPGEFHSGEEWSNGIFHPIEASRGQVAHADAYSPGWFQVPLQSGTSALLVVSAESDGAKLDAFPESATGGAKFEDQLIIASKAFLVRRGTGKTVIAGYPWFLDWGRDTLIAARGLLSAGCKHDVLEILKVFGRFEKDGTLPNSIHGNDASNRDTSDAPLWYGILCEDYVSGFNESERGKFYATPTAPLGPTIAEVLQNIASGYWRGTPNGIRADQQSVLIWSPPHFTWMDTNYPAGTPRMGYPVCIQAFWIRLLRHLARLGLKVAGLDAGELAARAEQSFQRFFWLELKQRWADVLTAEPGQSAASAIRDDALRSNFLFAISLGIVHGEKARAGVISAQRHLVVPGGLRSLAPLPVDTPLPIRRPDGGLLNDPHFPYWGRYEGDEDTRRKPAYHNGTAWVWTLPTFCEALAVAHDFSPASVSAARSYLAGQAALMESGCLGHLPEVLDGDAPHQERGCDAQAWSATETLRVWKILCESPARG